MAQFFKAKPNSSKQISSPINLHVSGIDNRGAGLSQYKGKVVFIPKALPGETVKVQLIEQKKQYAKSKLIKIEKGSEYRITPFCQYYQRCGGCDFQHTSGDYQRQLKQQIIQNLLERAAGVSIELSPAIFSKDWHYRRRARLATYYNKSTNQLALGFRAEQSKDVINIDSCQVITESMSSLIAPLSNILNRLQLKSTLGHVELLELNCIVYVILRITTKMSQKDIISLKSFVEKNNIVLLLQDNENQCVDLNGNAAYLSYDLFEGESLTFKPGNFIQINNDVNLAMINQALKWLAPTKEDRILDLFCGVGNFSIPLAKMGAHVIGVEGVADMVQQAQHNACVNQLTNLEFFHADLSGDLTQASWLGKIDKLLLDPARAGAYECLQWLKKMKPAKILYVSCNPVSLARDTQVLMEQGYQISKAGLIDMFPQTHHIETMVLFVKK